MRIISVGALIVLYLFVGTASAQTSNDLQIRLGGYTLSQNGGEKPVGVWFSTGPVALGKTATGTFSFGTTCEAFSVSSDGSLRDDATTAWRIELTPVRVVGDAVTFRLHWVRAAALPQRLDQLLRNAGKNTSDASNDVELTLRPGESWPVDTVKVPFGARTTDGRACGSLSLIRVSVDNYPGEEDERRLIAADLWLFERLSPKEGGDAQQGQRVSVRGLPNRPFRFYFDSINDGDVSLDIYGLLTAHPENSALSISVETRCRWKGPSVSGRFSGPQRRVTSEVEVKPDETVEIRLPALSETSAGSFAKRSFSIRIRARQLR